jgi:hypothetical protein
LRTDNQVLLNDNLTKLIKKREIKNSEYKQKQTSIQNFKLERSKNGKKEPTLIREIFKRVFQISCLENGSGQNERNIKANPHPKFGMIWLNDWRHQPKMAKITTVAPEDLRAYSKNRASKDC